METKNKALAYIFRDNNGVRELLVFDHRDFPEVNPQVPAGTVDDGETHETTVLREVFEESGIKLDRPSLYLGCFDYHRKDIDQFHKRHVYSFETKGLANKWEHIVSDGEDKGLAFDFYWLPVEEAREKLVGSMGDYLFTLSSSKEITWVSELNIQRELTEEFSNERRTGLRGNIELAMWLDLKDIDKNQNEIVLDEVKSSGDINLMTELRFDIEKEFGIESKDEVTPMIEDIQKLKSRFNDHWFLATNQGSVVGEIGIVPIETNLGKIGRLQDVDISPKYQGQGLGNKLLVALTEWAKENNYKFLCLRADENDWPHEWYSRFGFSVVDKWN